MALTQDKIDSDVVDICDQIRALARGIEDDELLITTMQRIIDFIEAPDCP